MTFQVDGITDIKINRMPEGEKKGHRTGTCERCKIQVGGCLVQMPDGALGFHCCNFDQDTEAKILPFDPEGTMCPAYATHQTSDNYRAALTTHCKPSNLFPGDEVYIAMNSKEG